MRGIECGSISTIMLVGSCRSVHVGISVIIHAFAILNQLLSTISLTNGGNYQ